MTSCCCIFNYKRDQTHRSYFQHVDENDLKVLKPSFHLCEAGIASILGISEFPHYFFFFFVFFFFFLFRLSHHGSPQRIFYLQLFLPSVSSSVTTTSAMSSFTTSINLFYGLPRFLFPDNSIISILLPICPSSFLRTCPYHLSLASRVFSPNRPTSAVPLMYSFLIVSIPVTPNENRIIFNSATSISSSCFLSVPLAPTRTTLLVSLCHIVHLPFHSSWHSPVADHS